MTDSVPAKCLLMGLPATGKTTFLAALWYLLHCGEVDTELSFQELHGDHSHLEQICQKWLSMEPLERTLIAGDTEVSMRLKDVQSGRAVEIAFPDLAGESFETQWTDHVILESYRQLVEDCQGSLLLIHPGRIRDDVLIPEVMPVVKAVEAVASAAQVASDFIPEELLNSPKKGTPEWNPQFAPTQLQLVEIVQILLSIAPRKPFPLAVLVSAWDTLESHDKTPSEWIAGRLPLLYQFLLANNESVVVRYYGVSAQGADYGEHSKRLRAYKRQSGRITVIEERKAKSHDLTVPIRWVLCESDVS
jgi:hypothetical protein